jgi:Tfp pilus assembly protein PilZ
MRGVKIMISEFAERRSDFRFPVIAPAEYFRPDDSGILSYSLDLSNKGTFISSDDPLNVGSRFGMNLTIPIDKESSKIFRTEGMVVWNKIQPFKSKRNGMGIEFIKPLPEVLLLSTLASNVRKLIKESEAKMVLEERVEKLESELEETKRLATLGCCVEKILLDLSDPILTLSGKLEIIKKKMNKYKRKLEEHEGINKEEFKKIVLELDDNCKEVDQILEDYKVITELSHIVSYDRETLERKLKRYHS